MLTAKQVEKRYDYVGATDVSAILGENRWKSRSDVWYEKVHRVSSFSGSEAADLGNRLETAVRDLAADALGVHVVSSNPFRVVAGTPIGVNLDAWFDRGGVTIPVEVKTAGLMNPHWAGMDEWGEDWSDQIPTQYTLQLHAQMMATNAPEAYLSGLIAGRGHAMFHVERSEDLCEMIREASIDFWACVRDRRDPGDLPSLATLAAIQRPPASVAGLGVDAAGVVARWRRAVDLAKAADDAVDEAKAGVIAALGEAECGLFDTPLPADAADELSVSAGVDAGEIRDRCFMSYREQARSGIDASILRRDYPEAFEAAQKISTFRVLRMGKTPKGTEVTV